jgi:hypothetical protein
MSNFSPLLEDFRYETGVFNPCRAVEQTRNNDCGFWFLNPVEQLSTINYQLSKVSERGRSHYQLSTMFDPTKN